MKTLSKKGIMALLFVILFGALINSCDDSKPLGPDLPKPTSVKGVLQNEYGEAIPNATMEIIKTSNAKVSIQENKVILVDTTDENGNYEFKQISGNFANLILRVQHPDLKPFQINLAKFVKGKDKGNANVDVQCKDDCCGKIVFKVLGGDSTSVSGAIIKIYQRNTYKRKALTDKDGMHTFEKVCEGTYWARIFKKGYKVQNVSDIKVKGCDEKDKVELTVFLKKEGADIKKCKGSIKVIVKDKETGKTLNKAMVKLFHNGRYYGKDYTNRGYVNFTDMCEGGYKIVAGYKGYNNGEANITLKKNENKEVTIELEKNKCCEGKMDIQVIDENKKPLQYVLVQLMQNQDKIMQGFTDKNGKILLSNICKGKYYVYFEKTGYEAFKITKEMPCNETLQIVETMNKSKADSGNKQVTIYVRDKNKKAIEGAKVELFVGNQTPRGKASTGAKGSVSFSNLREGSYFVVVSKDGYTKGRNSFYLSSNDKQKDVFITLQKNGEDKCHKGVIEIEVTDRDGKSLPYVVASIFKDDELINASKTNKNGFVTLYKLYKGAYQLKLSKTGYKEVVSKVQIGCDQTLKIKKQMRKLTDKDSCFTASMKILVKDKNKNSIANARIFVFLDGTMYAKGVTNKGGYWLQESLQSPAKYIVKIVKQGYKDARFEMVYDKCKKLYKTVVIKK